MICKYCHSEISDNAKFCPECGKKVEDDSIVEVEAEVEEEEPAISLYSAAEEEYIDSVAKEVEVEVLNDGKVRNWFYIAAGKTVGPYSEEEMLNFIHDGTVSKNTYVWKEGNADWVYASNSLLGNFFEEPTSRESYSFEEETTDSKEWYYADNGNNQHGPFTEKEMIQKIQAGIIGPKNYVWKPGLSEWVFLNQSNLSGYAKQEAPRNTQTNTQQTRTKASAYRTVSVTNRSIALQVILSIVTCGLYSLYWQYTLVKDFNSIATSQGKQQVFDAGLAVLLSIVTCGLFSFYLYWKMGNVIGTCSNKYGNRMEDTGIVMLLLAVFGLAIVSMCIAQSQVNECA
ncbi:MAG: DUF4339 domain-containing protein [Firmicutes bacterium]|nr:DUF4339 domain-containing protein [Bacillota bacterium]